MRYVGSGARKAALALFALLSTSGCKLALNHELGQDSARLAPAALSAILQTYPSNPSGNSVAAFAFSSSGATGSARYSCSLDSGAFADCVSPYVTSGLALGPHAFKVRVFDPDSGKSSEASYDWTVTLPTDWEYKGPPGISTGASFYNKIAIAPDGTQYVAYSDSANGNKLTVKKFAAGAWVTVGAASISTGSSNDGALAIDSSGTPFVAYSDSGVFSGSIVVKKFDGTNWVNVGAGALEGGSCSGNVIAFDASGAPYVAYTKSATSKITVRKYSAGAWSTVGAADFSPAFTSEFKLAVTGSGTPYVFFRDFSVGMAGSVLTFDGTSWVNVGAAGFTGGMITAPAIAVDSTGVPHVAFQLMSPSRVQVMRFDGSSWASVGDLSGIFAGSGENSIAFGPSDSLYVASHDRIESSRITVARWNGSSWNYVGSSAWPSTSVTDLDLSVDPSGTPYFVVTDSLDKRNSVFVLRTYRPATAPGWLQSSPQALTSVTAGWTLSRDPLLTNQKLQYYADPFCSTPAGAIIDLGSPSVDSDAYVGASSQFRSFRIQSIFLSGEDSWSECSAEMAFTSIWTYVGGIKAALRAPGAGSLAFSPGGTPYVAYVESSNRVSVSKFDGTQWVQVGARGFSPGTGYARIAISSTGVPYVVYRNTSNGYKLDVLSFDGTQWNLVGPAAFANGNVSDLPEIRIVGASTPYVLYGDQDNAGKLTLKKFDGTSWVTVGAAGFSAIAATPTLAVDSSGTPFIAYRNGGAASPAVVMKFDGTSWVNVGAPGFATVNWYYHLTLDPSGTPYFAYQDTGNRLTVMKFDGTNWVGVGPASFAGTWVQHPLIATDPAGLPYVVYQNWAGNYALSVYKFDGSNWNIVGPAEVSNVQGNPYTLVVEPATGKPWLVYSDSTIPLAIRRYDP